MSKVFRFLLSLVTAERKVAMDWISIDQVCEMFNGNCCVLELSS